MIKDLLSALKENNINPTFINSIFNEGGDDEILIEFSTTEIAFLFRDDFVISKIKD